MWLVRRLVGCFGCQWKMYYLVTWRQQNCAVLQHSARTCRIVCLIFNKHPVLALWASAGCLFHWENNIYLKNLFGLQWLVVETPDCALQTCAPEQLWQHPVAGDSCGLSEAERDGILRCFNESELLLPLAGVRIVHQLTLLWQAGLCVPFGRMHFACWTKLRSEARWCYS